MASDAFQASPLLASFRASYADLLRYLTHRTGSADEAHDLAHDAWLRAADMARQGCEPALGSDSEARAYLFTMARHLMVDRHRRQGVAQRYADSQGAGGGLPMPASGQAPDVAEAAMYGQAVRAVEAALAGLPERAREVFLRHRVQGEDQAALAAAYGVSRNMIERDMMLAMDRVQAALERWHAGAVGDGGVPATRRVGRRRSLTALLGVAGLALGGAGGWRWWRMAVPQWRQVAATGHGRTVRIALPDGGQVTLDAQTRVEMAFYAGWRSARLLAGAAFFEVAGDPGRPFVVDVPADAGEGGLRVTVLGTRFGVERLPGGGVQVQVESGRVRVEAPDVGQGTALHELTSGMSLRWSPGASAGEGVRVDRLPEPGQAAGWRHGVVAFDDAPLQDVLDRLRRYLPRPVAVSPDAAGLRLSGQVRIAQAEDFVRALPGVLPVRSRLTQGRWLVERKG